jgi:hypothetical protein
MQYQLMVEDMKFGLIWIKIMVSLPLSEKQLKEQIVKINISFLHKKARLILLFYEFNFL